MVLTNDPLFRSQWYLVNTGQRGEPGYDLNLLSIWGRYSGRGLVIAINDDGKDLAQPDLAANPRVDLAFDAERNMQPRRHRTVELHRQQVHHRVGCDHPRRQAD